MAASLETALRLKRDGDFDGAVIALEAVLDRHPANPIALVHLAEVQMRRGRLSEAAAALDRAEEAAGASSFSARVRGDLRYKQGRYREAARAYQDAEALGETGTWSLLRFARCQLRLGDLDAARGAAVRAAERDTKSAAPYVLLGEIAEKDGDLAQAEVMYARAHDRQPDDKRAHAKLVEARLRQLPPEQRDREIAVLLKSTGRANEQLVEVLARARAERGDNAEAAEAWGARVELKADTWSRKMHGFALRRAGKLDEAAQVLGRCLAEDPEDLILFRTYVHLQRQRGALDELRRSLEELAPRAGSRRGAVYGELRKLPAPAESEAPPAESERSQPAERELPFPAEGTTSSGREA